MNILRQHLSDPEYLHTLINPLPVYGLAVGLLALGLALILRNQRVTIAALVLVFVCALSAWPTYYYGEAGYDRVKAMSDPAGEQWLDEHMARAEKMIWLFYVLAGVAAVGVGAVLKWPRISFAIAVGTRCVERSDSRHRRLHRVCGRSRSSQGIPVRASATGALKNIIMANNSRRPIRISTPPVPSSTESAQPQMEHGDHDKMPSGAEQPKTEEEKKQLEASRLQLEASRLQLEASRKQLENWWSKSIGQCKSKSLGVPTPTR